jgi:oligoribonuclease NrnB/cAMP/cGMP phosphodiesterase (DHH superfamily)
MTKFIEHRNGRRSASKDTVVLYHAECTDGFTAAWAAFRKFGTRAQYIPVEHQVPPPEGLAGKTVYMLDFTYSRPVTEQLMRVCKQVTAIDHHVTVEDVTRLTHDYRYALDKSGARLAWEYFRPDEPVPYLVRIVEDMDIYRFAIPDTVTLYDWLDLFDFDFKQYTKLVRQVESPTGLKRALRQGLLVRQYREKMVERLVKNAAYEVQFAGFRVRAVTTELFHHEVANTLARGRPFGVAWRVRRNGVYVSLRSDGSGIHVGEFAKRYGGGGHAHAAGFLVPTVADLPFGPVGENMPL